MSELLMRTGGATREEIDGLVEQLNAHDIASYETHAGFWGLGIQALWISDSADLARARELMSDYQADFAAQSRAEYQREAPTFAGKLARRPLAVVGALAGVAAVAAISLVPFFNLI